MYCNSCMLSINKDDLVHCSQCGVPLHKDCANSCMECGKILCDTCYAQNNYKCEDCYKPENTFPVIRRSHLEQYAGCPYSLYLQLILNITPPMGAAAQLGVITHELIDLFSSDDSVTFDYINKKLDEDVIEWNKNNKDGEYSHITDELIEAGHICLANYMNIKDLFPKDSKSEYNIQFQLDENLPKVSCTLDRIVERENGSLEIHDWKTGKAMSGKKLVTDLQPPLYIYAVYKEFGKMPDSFTLHYLRSDKTIVYNRIDDNKYEVKTSRATYELDINEAIERTKEILKGIRDNHFNMPDEKTHQWRCKSMCWFGISGKCGGSFTQQWRELNG